MCLYRVSKEPLPAPTEEIVAYKAFKVIKGELYPHYRNGVQKPGKWLKAVGRYIESDEHSSKTFSCRVTYRTGFHAVKTLRNCQRFIEGCRGDRTIILPVTLRNIVAHGKQRNVDCWVAREMWIDPIVAKKAIDKKMKFLVKAGY